MISGIFSIKEEDEHTVVSFLGIKLRISKPVNQQLIQDFLNQDIPPKTILLIELNKSHNETLPGYCKYLKDLGYNVRIIITNHDNSVFCRFSDNIKVWIFNKKELYYIFKHYNAQKYERVIYNSRGIYRKKCINIDTYFKNILKGRKENIYIQHHLEKLHEGGCKKQLILANPQNKDELKSLVVNPHYFGETKRGQCKNNLTNFIVIGALESKRKNMDLLIQSVKRLLANKITDFKITVVGKGSMQNLSDEMLSYFDIKGKLPFNEMYNEIEKADFILTLLDPKLPEHSRYLKDGTSGTYQLVYGFNIPCLIHKEFAKINGFDCTNSVLYTQNNLADAMASAINMNNTEYTNMCESLKHLSDKIYSESLDNLKNCLDGE